MTALSVRLSSSPAAAHWGKNPVLSYTESGATLHLNGDDRLRRIQQGGRRLAAMGVQAVQLEGEGWDLAGQWAFAQGFTTARQPLAIAWAPLPDAELTELLARVRVSHWVREQINRCPEDLSPVALCENAAAFISELAPGQISYRILKGEELEREGWVGVWHVGRGSDRPPAMLQLDFNPQGDSAAPVKAALVGKGITFDSGGYSMKASEAMLGMKADMGGAATVTGGLALAILRGLKQRVSLILCCAENLVSGHAYKLGDILRYKNGVSVEIVNTDAEGRLVLADGLQYAASLNPELIIDAATLTGAAVTALGTDYHAVFALDTTLRSRYLALADAENEPHWPLPLARWHQNNAPSAYADTANSRPVKGGGPGGASNAAGFLSRFVPNEGKGWLHLDLAAADQGSDGALWSAGATGLGIRTLARLLVD